MFNLFKKKTKPASYKLKPSDEECIQLAKLYDMWNDYKTMESKVAFLTCARSIIRKNHDQIPFDYARFDYDTESGYLDITERSISLD